MKSWQKIIGINLAMIATSGWAEEANSIAQLNKLRNLPEQVFQDSREALAVSTPEKPWALSMGSGVTYTSNANLTSSDAKGDFYAANSLSLRRQVPLSQGVTLSSGLEVTDYRYGHHPGLNTSFLDWDLMVNWSGTLSTLKWQGYLSHTTEATQQQAFKAKTLSSIIALGGSVTRTIAHGHDLSASAELSATPYTWPSDNAYGCVSISTAYDWKAARSITLNVSVRSYETLYFTGRRDFTASSAATLTWAPTSWLSAAVFASPSWNFSTQPGGDYSAVDTGVTISGNWSF